MAVFSANQITAFESKAFQIIDLIDISFYDYNTDAYDDVVRLTTTSYDKDVTISGTPYTYYGGLFKTLNNVPSDAEINRRSLSISLSGLSLMLVQSIQENNFVNAPITFRKLILDNTGAQVDDPVTTYIGHIETAKYTVSGKSSDLSFSVTHDLFNFSRKNAVSTNNSSFKNWCANNGYTAGSEFVGIDLVQDFPWGRG